MALKLPCLVLLMCTVMIIGSARNARSGVTCGQVVTGIAPCLEYLQGGAVLPPACCSGVKSLNAAAKTTPDRQTACKCLKSAAASIPDLDYGRTAALPTKCHVIIPYPIKPSTDCNKVK